MHPTQTTPTNGRPTVHPDWLETGSGYTDGPGSKEWQETAKRIYRTLYPTGRTTFSAFDLYPIEEPDESESRFLDLDARLFDADAVEELPDDMGEWS